MLPRPWAALLAIALASAACARAPRDDGTGDAGTTGAAGTAAAGATGTGGAGAGASCEPRPPSPASSSAAFPFPQHRVSNACSYPASCNDDDVSLAWTKWKQTFVADAGGGALRVKRPGNANDTVSEGIAYGMLAAVYLGDRATFDGLWLYAQKRLDENGVMNWHYDANGGLLDGGGGATDADEDIAFALVMADAQWSQSGSIGYAGAARAMIGNILAHEVEPGTNVIKPGDRWGGSSQTNPSYLAPSYYRVFARYTGDSRWMAVVDAGYALLAKCAHPTTGLVPDWCNADGAPQRGSHYSYDACRTPWRIAVDACWNGEPRAQAYLARVSAFFAKQGAANIKDGYDLDGTPVGQSNALSFVGPAGAGALAGPPSTLTRDAYTRVKAVTRLAAGSGYGYYDASWGVLSLLLMTGNLVDLGAAN